MTDKNLTATEIGAALARSPSSVEAIRLQQACEPRRNELRARLAQILPNAIHGDPPERERALLTGPAAVLELNREAELCRIELDQLERLELMCVEAQEAALNAEARKEIPVAIKKLPRLIEHLRETMSAYDAAVAALQSALHVIGEFGRLPNGEYPLDDDALAELLELRADVWRVRTLGVPHNVPPMDALAFTVPSSPPIKVAGGDIIERFPKSYALLYQCHGDVIELRRPPAVAQRPESGGDHGTRHAWPRVN